MLGHIPKQNAIRDLLRVFGWVQIVSANMDGPGWGDKSGYVVTASISSNRDELIDATQARPVQYLSMALGITREYLIMQHLKHQIR